MNSLATPASRETASVGGSSYMLALALALAVVASASTWFYTDYILRAQQIADAAAHGRPRGNLSDLYPRWLGARELLLHGRDPYSGEITREIQRGYYGRPLDPTRADDPKDQQGFAYPVYVVFLLAPTVNFPFEVVETGFRWLLIGLTIATVLLWLRVVRWKISPASALVFAVLALGWLPMVQGIKLQQLSLLVAAFLAACGACLVGGYLWLGGALLALTTIKPQLAWPVAVWLVAWALSDWRTRKRFVFGFAAVLALLLLGAQVILPGWPRMFIEAIGQYHRYTQNESVLVWMFGSIVGRIFEVSCALGCAALVWRSRHLPASNPKFGRATSLILALTVVIVPMFAPYNQVLLLPAILVLIRTATSKNPFLPALGLAGIIGLVLLVWPWIATVMLTLSYPWITASVRQHLWPMPFYSNFMLPIFIFGLAALDFWTNASSGLRESSAAE
jgi:hypothetical protein